MPNSLSDVAQTEFDALVKAEYHSRGFLLRDSNRKRTDVIGNQVQFRKVNEVIANETAYMASVTPQDPGYSPILCNIVKYTAPTAVDVVEELTVNFDVKMENAMLVADALGRRSDQICIDALEADPGDSIVNGGTNFTYVKYTQMIEFFDDNAVPLADRFVAMSANSFKSLLQEDEFTSTFYTQNRVLDRGFIREYLGVNVIVIPAMTEGGLPKTGNIRKCFAWHKQALGMAIGHNFRTEINYLPRETSWLINGIFSAGAVVIDNRGVIEIDCDESA